MNIKLFAAFTLLAAALGAAPSTMAQDSEFKLPDFVALQAKAKDCVDITLGPWMLHSVAVFLDDNDPDDADTKRILKRIQSIQIRSFEFDSDNAYAPADLDAVRKQLQAPGWTRMLNVHERAPAQNVDMYMLVQNEQTHGFALIASDPRQFTIINIVGSIDISDLPKLQKYLHMDKMHWPAAAAQL